MNKIILFLMSLFLSIFLSFACLKPAETGSIQVQIEQVRNHEGQVIISLYSPEDDFPYHPFQTFTFDKSEMEGTSIVYTIEGVRVGEYAVVLLDDENQNKDMDYNWMGIPQEGYGFSNNAKPRMLKAPGFSDCAFQVGEGQKALSITMKYF